MTTEQDEAALRIAAETNCVQPEGCGSCNEWVIEFARRLLAWQRERAEPVAWMFRWKKDNQLYGIKENPNMDSFEERELSITPLYAAPAPSQDERDAKSDVERYLTTFAHYHVNKIDGTDTCKQCGLDLRDPIHLTEWREAQIAKYAAMRGKEEG